MKKDEILNIFEETGALLKGHFLLTSGLHSDLYFQCALVLQYPKYAEQLCAMIVNHFRNSEIDVVISPAIGGIVVGQEAGRQLGKPSIFAERENAEMRLRRGFSIKPGTKILVCEDVVTTGGSVKEVINLVEKNNAEVAGVGVIVDRSNGTVDFGYPQFACVSLKVETFAPDKCKMCAQDDQPVKPGSRNL